MSVDLLTPIDRYLAMQQGRSAVERFAEAHDADLLAPDARWYSDRMPASPPGPGEQYAFQVDLDRCTGCKSCVAACHSLNGLDVGESWRSVGQLVGTNGGAARNQTVPSGCHHCLEPACMAGCPTNAYEKDAATGIVRHLDDQCIGCGYCELTCPYEVPKLNHRLGIVRKCDMCADRLRDGEAPACVQACPTSAITIAVVDTAAVAAATRSGSLVPGAPASGITGPTTRYLSRQPLDADLRAADHHALNLSPSHPPLAVMLVLTQLSVGAFVATWMTALVGTLTVATAVGAAAVAGVALAASLLHVGRPLVAYRALLGIRHSWMSREVAAFGVYALLAFGYAVGAAVGRVPDAVVTGIGGAAALVGAAGVWCSAQIYVVTRRPWWATRFTLAKFGLTCAGAGPVLAVATLLAAAAGSKAEIADSVTVLAVVSASCTALALVCEAWFLRPGRWDSDSDLGRTAGLLRRRLAVATCWRFALGAIGGIGLPVALAVTASPGDAVTWAHALTALIALLAVVASLLIERYQFFVASVAPRMPGGFRR